MALTPSLEAEALVVLGGPVESATPLAHGEKLSVTRAVWRVRAGGRSAIRKLIGPDDADGASSASSDLTHFRYWRREALLYEHGLPPSYLDAEIAAPALLGRFDQPEGTIALWLADVVGRPGTSWSVDDFGVVARRLGRAQAGEIPSWPWLSRDFLRRYLESWGHVDFSMLGSARAWATPLVAEATDWLDVEALREGLTGIFESRAAYLDWLAAAPRTFCHLDLWPHNLFAAAHSTVAIDWGFCGVGALGEDIGNLVLDSVFDLLQPAAVLPQLDAVVFDEYLAGLRDVGWSGDPRLVRLAMCSSAVKYCWLAPMMLARATAGEHRAYGGAAVENRTPYYVARFAGLAFMLRWADEASRLAASLRLPRD